MIKNVPLGYQIKSAALISIFAFKGKCKSHVRCGGSLYNIVYSVLSLTFAFIDAIFPSIFIQFCLTFLPSPLPRCVFAKKKARLQLIVLENIKCLSLSQLLQSRAVHRTAFYETGIEAPISGEESLGDKIAHMPYMWADVPHHPHTICSMEFHSQPRNIPRGCEAERNGDVPYVLWLNIGG